MRAPRFPRLVPLLALTLFLVLGLGVSLGTPVDAGPDEPSVQQYAHYLAETGGLPDPTAVDVVQSQHPPLYYAWLAAWLAASPGFDGDTEAPPPKRLPYERAVRVAFDRQRTDLTAPSRRTLRAAKGEMPPTRHPYRLRFAGLLLGLASAALVFVGVRRALPERPATGALAAAVVVLIPQFAVLFATPVNDQIAILLCTAALALLAKPGEDLRTVAFAAVLFGLAFLGKILVLGPFVAGAVLAATRCRGGRWRSLLVLAAGPVLIASWWYLRQWALTGSPIATEITARNHPGFIRSDGPDAWELVQVVGGLARNWLGVIGGVKTISPGESWMMLAGLLPILVLAAAARLLFGRVADAGERRLGVAAVSGALSTLAILLYGCRWFVVSEGRYLHILALPVAWTLAAGLPRLLGRGANPLLGAMAVLMAVGGITLLHLGILPRHHPDLDVASMKGGVRYLDLGADSARPAVVAGRSQDNWGFRVPDADRRMVAGPGDAPQAFAVKLDGLDATELMLLSYRVFPPLPMYGKDLRSLSHVELRVGDDRLGGLFSSHARAATWIHAALPPARVGPGEVVITGQGRGTSIGLSQLALRRLPFRIRRARREGATLVVETEAVAEGLDGEFSLSWQRPAGGGLVKAAAAPPGEHRFVGLEASATSVSLVVEGPPVVIMDLKAVLAASPQALVSGRLVPARDMVASLASPGLFGLRLDGEHHGDHEVLRLDESHLPRADVTHLDFLDDQGRPVPDGCLSLARDGRRVPVTGGRLDLAGSGDLSGPWSFVAGEGETPVIVDRIVARAPLRWPLVLELER